MTEVTPNLTLAEIVNIHPSLARQLEAHELDDCCGGATTLQDACATKNLDVATVLDELAGAATHEPSDLLRQLRSLTHSYTPPADGCGSYVALVAGFETMEADTHLHMHKENNRLFPAAIAAEQQFAS